MSAAQKLRALDMHSAVLNGRYTLRSALPELIAVVECAEDVVAGISRGDRYHSPPAQEMVGCLNALDAKLSEVAE